MIQANENSGDTPLPEIVKEEKAPTEDQAQVPVPTAVRRKIIIVRKRGTVNTTGAVDTANTSPGPSHKRKRDVYDAEDSEDKAASEAVIVGEE